MVSVQVRDENGVELLQNANDVCTAEVTIQLTESVLSAVQQHALILTATPYRLTPQLPTCQPSLTLCDSMTGDTP